MISIASCGVTEIIPEVKGAWSSSNGIEGGGEAIGIFNEICSDDLAADSLGIDIGLGGEGDGVSCDLYGGDVDGNSFVAAVTYGIGGDNIKVEGVANAGIR